MSGCRRIEQSGDQDADASWKLNCIAVGGTPWLHQGWEVRSASPSPRSGSVENRSWRWLAVPPSQPPPILLLSQLVYSQMLTEPCITMQSLSIRYLSSLQFSLSNCQLSSVKIQHGIPSWAEKLGSAWLGSELRCCSYRIAWKCSGCSVQNMILDVSNVFYTLQNDQHK